MKDIYEITKATRAITAQLHILEQTSREDDEYIEIFGISFHRKKKAQKSIDTIRQEIRKIQEAAKKIEKISK